MTASDRRARALQLIEGLQTAAPQELTPDRVRSLGYMMLPPDTIKQDVDFKRVDDTFAPRVQATFLKSGFLAPIIIDQHMTLIDGAARVAAAVHFAVPRVAVLVVEATPLQASYLRLILDRSAEIQRWQWDDLDSWLYANADSYLSTLEPLGIFGEQVIPDSFMSNSMLEYRTDATHSQTAYGQEPGMALWAARRRVAAERGQDILPRQPPMDFQAASYKLHPAYPIAKLTPWPRLKRRLWERKKALKRSIGITGFVTPIVTTSDGKVLDGALRLEVVRELHEEGWWPTAAVPVVMVSVDENEAAFLRIVMNRTSEFQRWDHAAVDSFIDSNPHLRPLYEAYGLYTDKLLGAGVWAATALRFQRTAPGNGATYDPTTTTLAQWGEQQRARHFFEVAEKETTPLKPVGDYTPLFTLPWDDGALLPVHDVDSTMGEHVAAFLEQVPSMHKKPKSRQQV